MNDSLQNQFENIFRENLGIIISIARAYTKTRQDHEDLINDIALECWNSFKNFRGEAKISTWIYRIALNTALNYSRTAKRRTSIMDKASLEIIFTSQYREDDKKTELLYDCIDELDVFNRAIIIFYLDGKSHDEIAGITGISKTNVGTRISRIKEQLKKIIQEKSTI